MRDSAPTQRDVKKPPAILIAAALIALVAIIFAVHTCSQAAPINVTVNGSSYTLRGAKTMQVAIKESGWPVNPGDLISLNGNVLKRSAGDPFSANVNGTETADPNYRLYDGDVITLTDGKDIVEEYDAVESPVPYGMSITSLGCIHTFVEGSDGVMETRTGRISGETAEKQTVDPTDASENRRDPNVGDDKVIALTFDDGPTSAYTEQILEILAENNAKATFFCKGKLVEGDRAAIVRKAAEQGNQICSHGYECSSSGGIDIEKLSAEEQRNQITKGYESLASALGYEPSHVVRVGATDMSETTAVNVFDLVDAEVSWTLDTGDWIYMSEDQIYDILMSAKPGDIVRMHDGGDHQETTVSALKRALPKLVSKGYSFVTIDELMKY